MDAWTKLSKVQANFDTGRWNEKKRRLFMRLDGNPALGLRNVSESLMPRICQNYTDI